MINKSFLVSALVLCVLCADGASKAWLDATRPTKIYQSLNGNWESQDVEKPPYFQVEPSKDAWQERKVPISKEIPEKCAYRWWRKTFTLTEPVKQALAKGECGILYLGGRSERWKVIINGKEIIDSIDPVNIFNLDVTDALQPDGENTLIIGTTDRLAISNDEKGRKCIIPKVDSPTGGNTIWSDVELRMRPANRIEDIFVKPSWRKKLLDVDVEVVKGGKNWTVGGEVLNAKGESVLKIPFSGGSKIEDGLDLFKLSQKWADPLPWNVDHPYLYTLKIELKDPSGKISDTRRIEFGFRELWIEGENLMMNGRRLFLARKTIWPFWAHPNSLKRLATEYAKAAGINTLRVNRGAYYPLGELAWHADRLGLMLQPQHLCAPRSYDIYNPVLWRNYADFLKRWIRSERNHPSIVMWSPSNELLWCCYHEDKKHYLPEKLAEMAVVAKKHDPTRVCQFDGDWDLPPAAEQPVANLHYPTDPIKYCYPTECWKYLNPKEPFRVRGLTGRYNWIGDKKKPLIIGEFIWMWSSGNRPKSDAKYGGDKVFDWEFWRRRKLFNQNLRWFTDVWRVARYAGVNPWSHARSHFRFLIPYECVILRDQFRTFFSGEKVGLKGWVLNDTPVDHSYTVKWSLCRKKEALFEKSEDFEIQAGGIKPFTLALECPETAKPETLDLRIQIFRKTEKKARFDEKYPVRIHPKVNLVWPDATVLYDPIGKTRELLEKLGLKPKTIDSLANLGSAKALVIGKNALSKVSEKDLDETIPAFAARGGNLLCLSQAKWPRNFIYSGLKAPKETRANFAWIRSPGHPALEGLDNLDLGLWRFGDWVCDNSIEKPGFHNGVPWRPLLDTGDYSGLAYSPLLEVFPGQGRFLLCSMNLEKAEKDPGARRLLANLLVDLTRAAPKRGDLAFYGDEKGDLPQFLAAIGAPPLTGEQAKNAGVCLIDAAAAKLAPEEIAARVKSGSTVWLYNLTPENLAEWAKVIPGGLDLKPAEIKESCLIDYENYNPLLRGVSNQEFFWAGGTWTEAFRRLRKSPEDIHGVYPLAKIAEWRIEAPQGKAMLKPATMVEVADPKGRWLLSTINFEEGLRQLPSASYWFWQNLLNNLDIKFRPEKIRKIKEFTRLDLKKFANRSFQDEVKGDGKDGTWDFGPNYDYRFFPVNLSGYNDVGEPDPPPKEFPEIMEFEGVPFNIIDPRTNDNKSVVVTEAKAELLPKSGEHNYLREVIIPIERKFGRFYVLHSAGWSIPAPESMWTYVINYTDGSKVEFPVRRGFEVGDWWRIRPAKRASVAWRGKCLRGADICIYLSHFDNPHPEKKVASLGIISGLKSFGAIFGLTLADFQADKTNSK